MYMCVCVCISEESIRKERYLINNQNIKYYLVRS